jgi:hypothetical protein
MPWQMRDASATDRARVSQMFSRDGGNELRLSSRNDVDFRAVREFRENHEKCNRTVCGSAVTDNESAQLALSPRTLVS